MNKLKLLVISAFAIAAVAGSTLGLAIVFNGNGTFQTDEVISVGFVDLDVNLDPNAVTQKIVPVTNTGSTTVNVSVVLDIVDNATSGPAVGVTVSPEAQSFTLGPGQSSDVVFTISASNGRPVSTGTVALSVIRP